MSSEPLTRAARNAPTCSKALRRYSVALGKERWFGYALIPQRLPPRWTFGAGVEEDGAKRADEGEIGFGAEAGDLAGELCREASDHLVQESDDIAAHGGESPVTGKGLTGLIGTQGPDTEGAE